ncbi:hypothetical protein H257_07362 [Aphanomyces astaci]|uniref:Uncharacterized protein n=1 Tax=Aphanomyces astaci TaxID=112090 RepID=W4GJW9_APHAT|nr:hypothetical protein H257_07362 [Aphanomyces astaci]ETV79324.1 hypothetical protein H257_07362 [Aphanomyces astaci]|eukprot:XP_009831165.1 hypothetical protein H257_07362 [Aphanomyces astaci]
MISVQDTLRCHWASPSDVVLLPSLVKSFDATTLPPMSLQSHHHPHHQSLPSITSLLHRHHQSDPPSPDTGCHSTSPQPSLYHAMAYQTLHNDDATCSPNSVACSPHQLLSTHKPRWRLSKYCTVESCERVSQRNGLCHRHGGKRSCKEESCRAKDRGNGYCIRHGGGRPCDVANCGKKARRQGMCTQHYRVVHPN